MNVLLPYSHRYIEISREEGSTGVLPDNSSARLTSRCILFDGKNIFLKMCPEVDSASKNEYQGFLLG